MAANEIHLGDIGTIFEVTVKDDTAVVDISTATTKEIVWRRPDRSTLTRAASFATTGVDGKLRYTTVSGDLDQAGAWQLQVSVTLPTGVWHSDLVSFTVHQNL